MAQPTQRQLNGGCARPHSFSSFARMQSDCLQEVKPVKPEASKSEIVAVHT